MAIGDTNLLSRGTFNRVNSLNQNFDREIIECQDHCFRIYSNYLDMVLESPCFDTKEEAMAYEYNEDNDLWNDDGDINW